MPASSRGLVSTRVHQWEERTKVSPAASNHRRLVEVEVEVLRGPISPQSLMSSPRDWDLLGEQSSRCLADAEEPECKSTEFMSSPRDWHIGGEQSSQCLAPSLAADAEEPECNSSELADRALQRSEALLTSVAALLEPKDLRLPCLLGGRESESVYDSFLQTRQRPSIAEHFESLETATPIAARALAKSEFLLQELLDVECA